MTRREAAAERLGAPLCCVCSRPYSGPLRDVKLWTRSMPEIEQLSHLRVCSDTCEGRVVLHGVDVGFLKNGVVVLDAGFSYGDVMHASKKK